MGVEWTVLVWTKGADGWADEVLIETNSVWRALRAAIKAKRGGAGCVRIEWR